MILVTGGTGLVGSHLLLELVREHEEVVAVKRPGTDLEGVRRVFSFYSAEAGELFDHFVVNDELDGAIDTVEGILSSLPSPLDSPHDRTAD